MAKKTYGLIGKSLEHSFSPSYFNRKFEEEKINDSEYLLFPLNSIEEVSSLFLRNLDGLNVTIPYKESIIPYLDEIDEISKEVDAVNTIKFSNGKTKGYNTDVYGFKKSLTQFLGNSKGIDAIILGSGGASKAVQYVLKGLEVRHIVVSRSSKESNYSMLTPELIESHHLIINCTPLGMYPYEDSCPIIPYSFLSDKHYLFDLIYNPEKTLFLKKANLKGAKTKNGYEMLLFQAEKSWEIWNKD